MSAQAGPSAAPLQNIYYERKVGTPKPCYICRRPTAVVLATLKTEDFLYTCEGHLNDPGFASPIAPPPNTSGPSADDIKKVIADYHSREARKAEKPNSKDDKDTKEKDKDKDKNKDEGKDSSKSPSKDSPSSSGVNSPSIPTTTSPLPQTHRKYALHRQIFDMRKAELKRRDQGVKAKEVGKGLPQVPRGAF